MKVLLILNALIFSLFAQQERGKIDMHGGKEEYSYDKKSSFRGSTMGLSSFLENNSSKKMKPTKK